MKIKKRLDQYLLEEYPQFSRTQIQSYIMQGKAFVNKQKIIKAGTLVAEDDEILFNAEEPKYVCRAGWKLAHALEHFHIDVTGLVVLDAGLSTGGFTDCLLQLGAIKIYGVDVGHGQVHEKIRRDERVVVLEKTNLRYLEQLPELVDLVTLDLSFISVIKVIDAVDTLLKSQGKLIILIKPQFEAERHEIERGGLVTKPEVHERVIAQVVDALKARGYIFHGVTESPIKGTEGNKEFLGYFSKT